MATICYAIMTGEEALWLRLGLLPQRLTGPSAALEDSVFIQRPGKPTVYNTPAIGRGPGN